ncbi:similar to Saccharomyces cerevisiae YJL170C ASG7 Protein that regulates signaling from a G protein beta subunit Ste4p and its relocalization within the cell [Maudiozyma barnettii]|uniref:Similar to Saccharomyces cerevisiae YJL170C ASG7 Protein that regulates signaling from a G protein beta subunit Ste4p and its relocalization within the cell n=1 Tax=Maudiozyma barnettii TaxID=61262 RepID=A0A8H2ZI91_9SACH|nr:Asg7p [Kazachstania barnettii]CAB4254718.1 similar to Saccharomyces cerevisiae YJL170C ASG7 Protein that regulates signaling from a G protein beta subunit Ste4p and its relocalization within the cell [Kazachstania barnettii]CAD1782760.1 similar to Saccharomyces cerevisiae YJL170C ASG7 Protein that regulates signaling from a G protein beta subunit Ste4p and its relocalization within the cell [Kazachstania barnettii]
MPSEPTSILSNNMADPTLLQRTIQATLCQCSSCMHVCENRKLIQRSFFVGFIIPIVWILNIIYYIYSQYIIDHEVNHSKIDETELPTLFNKEQQNKKTEIELNDEIVLESERKNLRGMSLMPHSQSLLNEKEQIVSCSETLFSVDSTEELAEYRHNYLIQLSNNIILSHDELRRFSRVWAFRSWLGFIFYIIVAIFIYLLVSHSSSHTLYMSNNPTY